MPRVARYCPGGIAYHVLNRSVAKIKLFRTSKDYIVFERTLAEAMARLPVELLAYCIMPNHWHLVLLPRRDRELSEFMQWLTLTHAQRWRTSHDTVGYGPLYQGRFKSFPGQCDHHLLVLLRYVERNPVRANLVTSAQDWRWCSLYRRIIHPCDPPLELSPWPIEMPPDWLNLVNTPQTAAEEEALRTSIIRSRPFGSPAWQKRTAAALNLLSCFRPPGRPRRTR
jgi:putative transposase